MKLTKRKGFNFFRSYFDVYNELNDDDKVGFIDALLNKQFLGIDPTDLKGMARFAYISQTNSIDSQVKGFETKTGISLKSNSGKIDTHRQGGSDTPTHGVNKKIINPTVQVEVEEKEKEEYIYTEKEFLEDWKKVRLHFLKAPTNIKKLGTFESRCFDLAIKDFSKEDIRNAMQCLFKQEVQDIKSMFLQPKHFLENVEKYHNAHISNEYKLYGSKKVKYEL